MNNPGNLSDSKQRDRINALISDLEHLPESWGPETTNYFMRDFLAFENAENIELDEEDNGLKINNEKFNIEHLRSFLQWPEYSYWNGFVHLNTDLKYFYN